ncbi:lysozyme inhibitor LprI family protein [Luteibacter sp. RCC_6_2]|uniref:lysozyme inhibitor LprI family protein n=1 Tax=Luteibacter sp. RCC_6_2 TaxID=3239223 RepID=UPI0035232394
MRAVTKMCFSSIIVTTALVVVPATRAQRAVPAPYGLDEFSASLKLRASYQHCLDASGGATPGMQDCIDAEFAYQDKRLNAVYKRLMSTASASERIVLRNEERGWIVAKEKRCAVPESPGQGDIIDSASCVVTETAKRATELESRKIK